MWLIDGGPSMQLHCVTVELSRAAAEFIRTLYMFPPDMSGGYRRHKQSRGFALACGDFGRVRRGPLVLAGDDGGRKQEPKCSCDFEAHVKLKRAYFKSRPAASF